MITTEPLKADYAADAIQTWIREGRFLPGQRLPSERALAEELGINHLTVRRGMETLVTEGVIRKRPRVGNFVARPDRKPPVGQVALVLPRYMLHENHQHPVVPMLLGGISQALDQNRYSVMPLSYGPDQSCADLLPLLKDRGVRGMLLLSQHNTRLEHVRQVLQAGIEIVLLSEHARLLGVVPRVTVQVRSALPVIAEKLVALGHRSMLFCRYREDPNDGAFDHLLEQVLSEYELAPWTDHRVVIPNHRGTVDYRILAEVLDRRPTALVVPDEYAASEVFRLCHQRGIRIPQDLSLVAQMDNLPQVHPIPLSAMVTRDLYAQAARHAATSLAERMHGQREAILQEVFYHGPVRWTESVGPAPASAP